MKTMPGLNVCIHQPCLLPWIGFWNKVVSTDLCLILFDAQYSRGDYTNRVMLQGKWLTLPVIGAKSTTKILDCRVATGDVRRIGKTIEQTLCTKRHKYHERLHDLVSFLSWTQSTSLWEVNCALLEMVAVSMGLKVSWQTAPSMEGQTVTTRLQSTLRNVLRPVYYSGPAGLEYLKKDEWLHELCPVKMQVMKAGVSGDTVLQLIADEEKPLDVIRAAAEWRPW